MRSLSHALLAASLLAAAACHHPGPVLVPAQPSPTPPANPAPTAPQLEPMPPAPDNVNGAYALRRVGGNRLPAAGEAQGGCTVSVVAGTLSLERGRFTWAESQQHTCGGSRQTVSLRARGGYELSVSAIRLRADSGAFTTAEGAFLDRGAVQLDGVVFSAGGAGLPRRYVKRDLLPPSPNVP
jgi:hypothetical protein